MRDGSDIRDWEAATEGEWLAALDRERRYWSTSRDAFRLVREAEYRFYAGFYLWTTQRALMNPFRIDPARPDNFQIRTDEMAGRVLVDVGCGPASRTLSLVHCATVHALDPLLDFHRELQPFGWDKFASISAADAEQLPYDGESVDYVYCWKVLTAVRDPDLVLREIQRVLVPDGQLLLGCDLTGARQDRPPHVHRWSVDQFERRLLVDFEPVTEIDVQDDPGRGTRVWVCRLRKKD